MSALQFIKVPFKESLKVDFTRTSADAKPALLPGAMRNKSLKAIAALKPAKGTGFTYFYLIVDYFKNDKGVSEGHYLGFGKKPDVFKHLKKMMKGNGSKFFGAGDGKNVAIGEAYMDTDASGADIMYFKPDGACKMKVPAWNKAFKVIGKKYLKMACALAPADVAFEADPEMAAVAVEDGGQQAAGTQQAAGAGYDPAELTSMLSTSANGMAAVKSAIEKIKADNGSLTQQDLTAVQELLGNISQLKTVYQAAPAQYQNTEKIKAPYTKIVGQEPSIQRIIAVIQARLGGDSNAGEAATGGISPEIQAILDRADEMVSYAQNNYGRFKTEMETQQSPQIAGGDDFLNSVL